MIVRCIRNSGESLGLPSDGAMHTEQTVFDVTLGARYEVFGLGLFKATLLALVLDETEKPNWLPVGLFDFADCEIPPDWHFAVQDGIVASGVGSTYGWIARWGYAELVNDLSHVDALIEREPAALEVFYREVGRRRAGGEDGGH